MSIFYIPASMYARKYLNHSKTRLKSMKLLLPANDIFHTFWHLNWKFYLYILSNSFIMILWWSHSVLEMLISDVILLITNEDLCDKFAICELRSNGGALAKCQFKAPSFFNTSNFLGGAIFCRHQLGNLILAKFRPIVLFLLETLESSNLWFLLFLEN